MTDSILYVLCVVSWGALAVIYFRKKEYPLAVVDAVITVLMTVEAVRSFPQ